MRYENELEQKSKDESDRANMHAEVEAQHELKCQAIRLTVEQKATEDKEKEAREARTTALHLEVASIKQNSEQDKAQMVLEMKALADTHSLAMQQMAASNEQCLANITQTTNGRRRGGTG